jgi:outer membrane receptor protein involved in Fe transport
MPANSIKNVEVITDPGAKYDAEGVGGIINIIMAKNALDGVTGSVRANANTLGGYGFGGYISTKTGKLGLTANYGYNKTHIPAGRSVNEEFKYDNSLTDTPTHTIGEGKTKASGLFNYGNLEASLEIDTFNLVTVGANLMRGSTNNTSEQTSEMYKTLIGTSEMFYRYDRSSVDKSTYGAIGANVDYQHSTMKKDELLTISYNINREPNNSEGMTELTNVENYYLASEYPKWNINKAYTLENTGQIDYTRPIFKGQTIETGVKYINRTNRSKTEEFVQNSDSKEWVDNSRDNSDFKHTQHIYSAYLGYTLRFKKLGLKTGVRAEGTALNAKFAKNHEMDFKTDYFNVVPNATLTYQIGMTDQLKLGYNMRIQRPGIWYLNPYINDVNPQYVSQGNPDLGSEKSNAINLGYSKFGQKFSINANLSYTFINNSIESYNEVANFPESDPRHIYNGAIWGTYGNIGKKHTADMSLYLNWTPKSWFNIYMNGSAKYIDLDSKELNTSTRGWSGRIFGGTRFSLPKDWYIYVNGGYLSPQIQLQTKGNRYFFLSSNVNKDLLKKKLTISLGINNPFWKEIKLSSSTVTDGFSIRNDYYSKSRVGYISIAYKFGNLKEQIKKVSRGISNDDQISGGSSNSSGSGSAQ